MRHSLDKPSARRRIETLDYVQSMLGQLRVMAEAERCDMLAYLIEMAQLEAGDTIRGLKQGRARESSKDRVA
ncbi:MAG: hypothetical protein K5872_08595 [Rhizobiaceae bacterium]|nr:hypothetical protein [Rhizobiaceae bacterium]MCV0406274.1 hypothetical protein [Rhizobiaceae bacterium]